MNGEVTFSNLQPATYILTVVATNGYEKSVSKRLITVPGTDECAINMINSGLKNEDGAVTVQFAGVGPVSSYACYLDQAVYGGDCKSVCTAAMVKVKGMKLVFKKLLLNQHYTTTSHPSEYAYA